MHDLHKRLYRRWMNAKNDALGLYSHLTNTVHTTYPERAVFVTNDRDFLRQTKLVALRELGFPGEILPPAQAVTFLCNATGASLETLGIKSGHEPFNVGIYTLPILMIFLMIRIF